MWFKQWSASLGHTKPFEPQHNINSIVVHANNPISCEVETGEFKGFGYPVFVVSLRSV